MKRRIALLTMITCIFGLTACGGGKKLSDYEQQKVDTAISMVTTQLIPCIDQIIETPAAVEALNEYTAQEVEYTIGNSFGMQVDGNAFVKALESFGATYQEIGGSGSIGDAKAEIDGNSIIVNVDIAGPKQDAKAEVVVSNDFFFTLKSASLNKVESMGGLMGKAALNTVLGMGTVFVVLILIILVISSFNLIPKVQAMFSKKEDERTAGIDKAVARIAEQEENPSSSDDLELVAVIAAAIAASEGAASTDGFVVRSIRRRRVF